MKNLLSRAAGILLAAVFIFAAVQKILHPEAFALAVYRYHLLPDSLVNLCAIYLPWLELWAGLGVLRLRLRVAAVGILCGLLGVFTLAMAVSLARGLDIECGCFTAGGGARVAWLSFARNVGLLFLGVLALRPRITRGATGAS
jgi:hypothetical protein